jgi:hypothetical protein
MQNRADSRRSLSPRYSPKLFRRYAGEPNTGTLQAANQFPRKRVCEKPFAVYQGIDREPMIDRLDEVANAFDEKQTATITVTTVVLQQLDRRGRLNKV